jgi:hypothetical protein
VCKPVNGTSCRMQAVDSIIPYGGGGVFRVSDSDPNLPWSYYPPNNSEGWFCLFIFAVSCFFFFGKKSEIEKIRIFGKFSRFERVQCVGVLCEQRHSMLSAKFCHSE